MKIYLTHFKCQLLTGSCSLSLELSQTSSNCYKITTITRTCTAFYHKTVNTIHYTVSVYNKGSLFDVCTNTNHHHHQHWSAGQTNKPPYKLRSHELEVRREETCRADLLRSCSVCEPLHLYLMRSQIFRSEESVKELHVTVLHHQTGRTEAWRFHKQKFLHNWGLMVQESF